MVTSNSLSGRLPRQLPATRVDDLTAAVPVRPDPARRPPLPGEVLVFVASAAVLVLEIVAMRLVAPYIGITLQTSSAVIGTALTAMALGAWLGGRLADRVSPGRVLGPLFVVGGLLTMLVVPVVRQVGPWVQGRPEVVAVLTLTSLALVLPAGVLSAIAPVVVKQALGDLGRTGSVVGRMSGIGTAGGITATFLTGFVLLSALRTSEILVGTGIVLVLAGGLLLLPSPRLAVVGTAACALALVPWSFAVSPDPCQLETAYHCVRIEPDQAFPSVRRLWLDTLNHSYVDLSDAQALGFAYVRVMVAAVDAVRPGAEPINGLYVGGGGFTLPRYEAATRAGSQATVAEIDPGVVDVARRYLGADEIPQMNVRVGDGRTTVAAQPAARYDVVFGDAFGDLAVPWHLTTREAAADLHRVLRPGGLYVVNVIDYQSDAFVRAELATLEQVFGHVVLAAPAGTLAGGGTGNHVLIASDGPLPVAELARGVAASEPDWEVADEAATQHFVGGARVLTDDLAPVDQLITTRPRGV